MPADAAGGWTGPKPNRCISTRRIFVRFPALRLAYQVAEAGGTPGAVLNAANEVAVAAFMAGKIPFGEICGVVEITISQHRIQTSPALDDLLDADRWARQAAESGIASRVIPSGACIPGVTKWMDDFMLVLHTALDYTLLALGLGFVIFFHELGHFLAAKYCDVKVEQFAVGFGPAIVAWRKGLGFRWGTTTPAYDQIIEQNVAAEQPGATQQKEIETNLRYPSSGQGHWRQARHWRDRIPSELDSPRRVCENARAGRSQARRDRRKPPRVQQQIRRAPNGDRLGRRGHERDPRRHRVHDHLHDGISRSPRRGGRKRFDESAARATRADGTQVGLQPGDAIIQYNDQWTYGDYSRIQLNVALTRDGTRMPILSHPDGHEETLYATPEKPADGNGLVELGITQPISMTALAADSEEPTDYALLAKTNLPDLGALRPAIRSPRSPAKT